jgi:hypothetical protein
MKYLFGDSTPFPLPFDFLRTLEAFMTAGTRVVLAEYRAQKLVDDAFSARLERTQHLEALDQLHASVLRTLDASTVAKNPIVLDYAKKLSGRAASLLKEQQDRVEEANSRNAAQAEAEREDANKESATQLRTFFQTARLPTLSSRLETTLTDGRPQARATLLHPNNVGVTFTLSTAKAPSWSAPRKLSDLVGHVELLMGIKKSWIGNKVSREPMRLDDWVIGSAELTDAAASIAIRKKPDQKDTLIFKLKREQGVLSALVDRPGDPNAALVPHSADPADLPHLDKLWTALSKTFNEIIEERAVVTSVTLDGDEVLGRDLGQKLVERLIAVLAPTTLEVAKKSPNANELSLKREGEGGRREELYLKREQLIATLAALPHERRGIFAPLGLEDWVPAVTSRAPLVSLTDEITSLELIED